MAPESMRRYEIRWLIRRDMQEVLEIEADCFGKLALSEQEFRAFMSDRNSIGMVVEDADRFRRVVGFMLYELDRKTLNLRSIAVASEYRDLGIGRHMLQRLEAKLSAQKRMAIRAKVNEDNLDAQLFFAACGWTCRGIEHGATVDGRDALVFDRRVYDTQEAEAWGLW